MVVNENIYPIEPHQPFVTEDMVTSARLGFHILFRLKLYRIADSKELFNICDDFIVLPYAYTVPGYRKKKRFTRETAPWHCIRGKLINNMENRLRTKLIDADIEVSKSALGRAFDATLEDLHCYGIRFNEAVLTLELVEFRPYNVTNLITKLLIKMQAVYLVDRATDYKYSFGVNILGFELPSDELERFRVINNYILRNNNITNNWKLEIEERKAVVFRKALSDDIQY